MKTIILLTIVTLAIQSSIKLIGSHPNDQIRLNYLNSIEKTWVAGHNKRWEDVNMEVIKGMMGTFLDVPEELKLPILEVEVNPEAIPATFDGRQAWPNCQSFNDIRDQSSCGSCWAHGSSEAFTDRICVASNQQSQIRISAQDVNSCCSSCGQGCNGGYPGAAWQWFVRTGAVTGFLYQNLTWCLPYSLPPCDHHTTGQYGPCPSNEYPTPACTRQCQSSYTTNNYANDKQHAKSAYGLPNSVTAIQTDLQAKGSVTASFTVYEDFLSYKSGVYVHTSGQALGGHSVKILGWGVQNNVPYWLVANSWNSDWGAQGYFLILRGRNECGIESQIVAGNV